MYNIKYKEACEICLKEMFKRVGKKYPDKNFTSQKNWYNKITWTKEEEFKFVKWMQKYLKKNFYWTKKAIDSEIGMFLLMWGWRTKK